jgi:hypothetical protein
LNNTGSLFYNLGRQGGNSLKKIQPKFSEGRGIYKPLT